MYICVCEKECVSVYMPAPMCIFPYVHSYASVHACMHLCNISVCACEKDRFEQS